MIKPRAYKDIDEYIGQFSGEIRERLATMRRVIREEAPTAAETISYQMPTFKLNGNLVHFAAFKNHLGFFPTPSGIEPFRTELGSYVTSKGTIQLPYEQPLPISLIRKIVRLRVEQNSNKTK